MGFIKEQWRKVRPQVVRDLLYGYVRGLGSTLRVKTVNEPPLEKSIVCGWHGRSLVFGNHFRQRGLWVVISQSNDGDIQNHIFTRLGYQTIRGSTGRNGVRALIESIRALKAGGTMAMTPDGPRGPSGVVQGGVMVMAQKSGAALIPIGITAKPRFLAGSWDHYMLPLPFAKALMIFGEPLYVPEKATVDEVEEVRLKLENEMHRLQDLAESQL